MKRLATAVLIAGGMLAASVSAAGAATVFSNPISDPPLAGLASNDPASASTGQQIADDFWLLSDASVQGLTWYGNYGGDQPELGTQTDFSIRIFNDTGAGILPEGTAFYTAEVTAFASATGLTTTGDNRTVFSYSANLSAVSLLAGELYWISIVEADPATVNETWEWATTSSGSGAVNVLRSPNTAGEWIVDCSLNLGLSPGCANFSGRNNRAFSLYDTPAVAPVPLPAGAWLLLSALGGLGLAGWRRKHLK